LQNHVEIHHIRIDRRSDIHVVERAQDFSTHVESDGAFRSRPDVGLEYGLFRFAAAVSTPSILALFSPVRVTRVDLNVISGKLATSKTASERRKPSTRGSPVLTLAGTSVN
jgi:hypothetical protein